MALQMSYTSPEGQVYPECYIVLTAIVLSPSGATLCTNYYAEKAVFDEGGLPLVQPAYRSEISLYDTGPAFNVSYQYLLTLPDFAGAVITGQN